MSEESAPPQGGKKPATPFTVKALERLRQLAEGNQIDPNDINVARTDEDNYSVHASMTLTPGWEVEEVKQQTVAGSPRPLSTLAEAEALRHAPMPRGWIEDAKSDLMPLPGHGWGLDGKRIAMPQHDRFYAVELNCPTCRGHKTNICEFCHGRGKVTCTHCHGAGKMHGTAQQCQECHGRNEIDCTHCHGTGNRQCVTCQGKGKQTRFFRQRLVAETSFGWVEGHELPTPLRRSIDRSGLAKLANGHAKIMLDPDENEQSSATIKYTASLPFAEVVFQIGEQKHRALVLGLKAAILEMPHFFDDVIDQMQATGTLSDMRMYKDAQALAAQRYKPESLLRVYPAGLSRASAEKIWAEARHGLIGATRNMRYISAIMAGLAAVAFIYSWFTFGLRDYVNLVLPFPMLIDLLLPLLLIAGVAYITRFVEMVRLKKLFGLAKASGNWVRPDVCAAAGVIVFAFVAYLLYGPVPPQWYTNYKVERQIEELSKNIDPPVM